MSSLGDAFLAAYRNLQLTPLLTDEELARFSVDYGQDTIDLLELAIEDCTPVNNKIIFAGHRGCGKSTLLGKVARNLQDDFFVVFFSIADLVEMSDVNHVNILFAIALQLMQKADDEKIPIPEDTHQAINTWFARRTSTKIEELKTELSGGFNLWEIIRSKLQIDASIRNELKQEFTNKISDLVGQLDEIAAAIETYSKRDILVIIDDLDKLEPKLAHDLFFNYINTLFSPSFRIVFTIPIAVMRDLLLRRTLETRSGNQVKSMSVAKLFGRGEDREPGAQPRAEVLATLKEMLHKRLPPELIEPEIARRLILYSGGVLRELIRLASECCVQCRLILRRDKDRQQLTIDDDILQRALNEIRNDFAASLRKIHYEILTTVYQQFLPDLPTEEAEQEFLDLLHGVYILEYRNADDWYDVHPVVVDLLRRRGLIGNGDDLGNG